MDDFWTSESTPTEPQPQPQPQPLPPNSVKKTVVAAIIAGSIVFGAGVGIALFGPTGAGAQTSTTTTVPDQSSTTVPGTTQPDHHCDHGQSNGGSGGTDSTPGTTPSAYRT
jgi:hypothetical protein